eukprot:2988877-Amphidinium_carterae.1
MDHHLDKSFLSQPPEHANMLVLGMPVLPTHVPKQNKGEAEQGHGPKQLVVLLWEAGVGGQDTFLSGCKERA